MVLAHAEHVQPQLVGQLDLLEQILQPLRHLGRAGSGADVGERGQAELHVA